MNRIEKVFLKLKEKNVKAFIPYIMAGDGGIDETRKRIVFLEKCGAAAIEIGVPFSDPIADGPTIQQAGIRALSEGTTLKDVFMLIKGLRAIVSIPLIVMTYMNPIYAYGMNSFIADAENAGVDGLIIPDLPVEEEEMITPVLKSAKIELIRLVALTSPMNRVKEIANRGKGFLYAVTVTGITGSRIDFNEEVGKYLQQIKNVSPLPVLAGFGISTPEQVKEISQFCDGVVVGSKIVDLFFQGNLVEIENLIQASKIASVN